MSSKIPAATDAERLREQASDWLQRQTTGFDPDDPIPDPRLRGETFLAWVKESPRHLGAVLEVQSLESLIQQTLELAPDALDPVGRLEEIERPEGGRTWGRWTVLALAATVLLAVAGALFLTLPRTEVYATAIGEQRWFDIEDGSRVYLNTNSRLRVSCSRHLCRAGLLQGEALFSLQHNPNRPFVLSAGEASIKDIATEFSVRLEGEDVEVSVIAGRVEVAAEARKPVQAQKPLQPSRDDSDTGASAELTLLSAGEIAHVSSGRVSKDPHPNLKHATMWRQRSVEFINTPLAEAAAEFNRYNRRIIRVEGSVGLRIWGTFLVDDPQLLIRMVDDDSSVLIEEDSQGWTIRPR